MHGNAHKLKCIPCNHAMYKKNHNSLRITILSLAVLAALMESVIIGNETELVGLLTTVGNMYMYIINHLGKTGSSLLICTVTRG